MYKVINGISPLTMNEIFKLHDGGRYILRHQNTFKILLVNTVYSITVQKQFHTWDLKLTILTGKNCVILNSVEEWLLGCF